MKIPTLIVNLKRSPDRREYMERLLSPFRDLLEIHFVEAVDGKMLLENEKDAILCAAGRQARHEKLKFSDGEIGCALSHRKCFQYILEKGWDAALIFEDDIVLKDSPGFEKSVRFGQRFIEQSEKPTMLHLGARREMVVSPVWREDAVSVHRMVWASGTYAYFINKEGAAHMLSHAFPMIVDIDSWYFHWRNGLACFAVHPTVVTFYDNRNEKVSLIEKEREQNRIRRESRLKSWNRLFSRETREKIFRALYRRLFPTEFISDVIKP